MMKAKNYESFESHKQIHDDFLGKLGALTTPLDDATINFAKNW